MYFGQIYDMYVNDSDIACFMIGLLLYIIVKVSLSFFDESNFNLFKKSIVLVIFASFIRLTFYGVGNAGGPVFLIYILYHIYNISLIFVLNIYTLYVKTIVAPDRELGKFIEESSIAIVALLIVAEFGAQITKFGFYYIGEGLWNYEPFYQPYTISYIYFLCIIGTLLFVYRDRIIYKLRGTLIITELLCLFWTASEVIIRGNVNYMTVSYVLPILVILIMLHSRPFDMNTGAMSPLAFEVYCKSNKSKKTKMCFLVLQLNYEAGESTPVELGKDLYNIYSEKFNKALLFQLSNYRLVLGVISNDKDDSDTIKKLHDIYDESARPLYEKYKINYKVLIVEGLADEINEKNINDLFSYHISNMEVNEIKTVTHQHTSDYLEIQDIRDCLAEIHIKGDLNCDEVKIFFQPVKNVGTGKYTTAEALSRIEHPRLGMVSPDKYIPMAETFGYIHILSLIVLNKTCQSIKRLMNEGCEIDRIAVNFSLLDFNRQGMTESIVRIIATNDVPFNKIAIEITESQREEKIEDIKDKIEFLKTLGIAFYMDDFGTGFSNFRRMLELPFDVIKFDATLIDDPKHNKENKVIVKHFSEAFKQMGYSIQFEGIETKEQEAMSLNNYADYLQGYRYVGLLAFDEFMKFLVEQ